MPPYKTPYCTINLTKSDSPERHRFINISDLLQITSYIASVSILLHCIIHVQVSSARVRVTAYPRIGGQTWSTKIWSANHQQLSVPDLSLDVMFLYWTYCTCQVPREMIRPVASTAQSMTLYAECEAAYLIAAGAWNCQPGSRFFQRLKEFADDNNLMLSDLCRFWYV